LLPSAPNRPCKRIQGRKEGRYVVRKVYSIKKKRFGKQRSKSSTVRKNEGQGRRQGKTRRERRKDKEGLRKEKEGG